MGFEEDTYSSIFLALKHPVRRRILRILNESPSTYTQILNGLGVESGFLNYHLDSLGPLIAKNEGGQYRISEFGKAALALITRVEVPVKRESRGKKVLGRRINAAYISAALMVVALLVGAAIGMFVPQGHQATVTETHTKTTGGTTTVTVTTQQPPTANDDHRSIHSPTVIDSPGTYVLSADITNSSAETCIRITSSDVILDGQGHTIDGVDRYYSFGVGVAIDLTNVTVKNLRVRDWHYGIYYRNTTNGCIANNRASSTSGGMGILLQGSSNHTVINNTMEDGWIYLHRSSDSNVINNTVNYGGIYLIGSSDGNVINNVINFPVFLWPYGFGGINLAMSSGNNVINNTIKGPPESIDRFQVEAGIDVRSSHNNTFINNTATLFDIGIRIRSDTNTLANNTCSNNKYGIYLQNASSGTVTDNTVDSNDVGLTIEGSVNLTVTGNKVTSNKKYGMNLTSSSGNMIHDNYFDNENNARDDGENTWNITKTPGTNIVGGPFIGGNFWSDYAGTDSDGDGLGNDLWPYDSNGGIVHGGDFLPLLPIDR